MCEGYGQGYLNTKKSEILSLEKMCGSDYIRPIVSCFQKFFDVIFGGFFTQFCLNHWGSSA